MRIKYEEAISPTSISIEVSALCRGTRKLLMLSILAFSHSQQVALSKEWHHRTSTHVKQTGLSMSSTLMTFGICTDDIADQIVYAATRYATISILKLLQSACQCPSLTAGTSSLCS